MYFISGTKER